MMSTNILNSDTWIIKPIKNSVQQQNNYSIRLDIYRLLIKQERPLYASEIASILNDNHPFPLDGYPLSPYTVAKIIEHTEGTEQVFVALGEQSPYRYKAIH